MINKLCGSYLCRYEYAGIWIALMECIAEPQMIVSNEDTVFAKAFKKYDRMQNIKAVFHVICQIKRYTTTDQNQWME